MRRTSRLLVVVLTALALVAGCQGNYSGLRLTIAAGNDDGVYYPLANKLAQVWSGSLGMPLPTVLQTDGAVQNVELLREGKAQVAFSDADAVDYSIGATSTIRALARLYDDYIQVVVPAGSPVLRLADLSGKRVSIGDKESQTALVARRLLHTAGLTPGTDVTTENLSLNDSIKALRTGDIDAFIWSGGLPTDGISGLAATMPLRVLDLSDVLSIERTYPVYETATVPSRTYGMTGGSITTLIVPNYLLVTAAMPDDEAEALLRELFLGQDQLVKVNSAALGIDVRSAIYTSPVPLHDGALEYYRSNKT